MFKSVRYNSKSSCNLLFEQITSYFQFTLNLLLIHNICKSKFFSLLYSEIFLHIVYRNFSIPYKSKFFSIPILAKFFYPLHFTQLYTALYEIFLPAPIVPQKHIPIRNFFVHPKYCIYPILFKIFFIEPHFEIFFTSPILKISI